MIEDNFTSKNMLALIVPTGDYDKQSAILDELAQYDEVDSPQWVLPTLRRWMATCWPTS